MKGPDPQILFSSFLQTISMREYCYSLARVARSAPPTNGLLAAEFSSASTRGRERGRGGGSGGANGERHAREAMKAMWRPHQPRKLRRPAQRSTSTTLLTLPRKCWPWKIFAISREGLLVPALPQAMQRPGP
ncbi:hypothetical protein C367_06603 [Cryptococcus neoformans Ze90-1]|nr:hypothetical protein C367_06603 [Cryptococcus neoformans var. grubii Ze90-1]